MSVNAQFSTFCPDCGQPIKVGDSIHLLENVGWVHERCPNDPILDKLPSETTCHTCWLIHPEGACDRD